MTINPADLAFASWLAAEEKEQQKIIITARQFHEGGQNTQLTARLREFLGVGSDIEFNLNLCRTVVDVVEERLILTGMGTNEKPPKAKAPVVPTPDDPAAEPVPPEPVDLLDDLDETPPAPPVAAWADALFDAANLAIHQSTIHEGAIRDGQYFVLVDWDAVNQRPRFTPTQRYVDAAEGGDNYGCKAHYQDDDPSQELLYVSKRWVERIDLSRTRNRMTLYYPDRIEKYELVGGKMAPFQDPSDPTWPLPWVDKTGKPLGIPAIHFPNTSTLRPEAWDAIPLQRAINKALIDLLGAADLTGFRIFVALGWIPTTDGQPLKVDHSNMAKVGPASIIGTLKSKTEAGFDAIDGADLGSLIESINSLIQWFSIVTSTPASRVIFSGAVAAEGTLKQQNEGLFAKIRKRQALYNQAWIECFNMARRLANHFGNAGLDESVAFVPNWEPIQARDTTEEYEEWRIKKEMGIPLEVIWSEMGYSPAEIRAMKASEEYKSRNAMMMMGLNGLGGGSGQPEDEEDG